MEQTPVTQSIKFPDYSYHSIIDCAKRFYKDAEHQKNFEKWLKTYRKKKMNHDRGNT